ncbi:SCP2 sterol-binding domain-containing protein [Actinomadura atramentaria]|uniref:SCP2 sterol-binding domain-containing protein n=1 Tax=Actinomadura atramentaria TaxID=1990 RepID=UPI00036C0C8C|nr:SCP2 sterol-binding domain-containing protein [Actinomadura atramentaria]
MTETAIDLDDTEAVHALFDRIASPAELRGILDAPGADESTIEGFVAVIGAERLLDRVFDLMCEHFVGERAGGESGVVQWNVRAGGAEYSYHLTVADGAATRSSGPADKPRVTLNLTAGDLLRLCAGKLSGVQAVMSGKIKLQGDMMWGAKLPGWFNI